MFKMREFKCISGSIIKTLFMLKLYFNILLLVSFYTITMKSAEGQDKKFDVYERIEAAKQELLVNKVNLYYRMCWL